MAAPYPLFASCAPGLEPLLLAELVALGALDPELRAGGVAFGGHRRLVARANLWLGTASHVLVRVGAVHARRFGSLVRELAQLPWEEFLLRGTPFEVRVSTRHCRLHHTGAVEQRVREAVGLRFGATPPSPKGSAAGGADGSTTAAPPDEVPAVLIRGEDDRFVVSLDTSGSPLHRRGWRVETGAAPLREDLAHALILASGWDTNTPLVDPFCGAGTIVIEAAALARRLAPGRQRRFALERTAIHHGPTWMQERARAQSLALPRAPAPIRGSDRSAVAIRTARRNAERACVAGDIELVAAPVSRTPTLAVDAGSGERSGAVVTNPPFGHRVGDVSRLRALYQTLGKRLAALHEAPDADWRLGLLASDRRMAHAVGRPLRSAFLTDHGGLKVRGMASPRPGADDEPDDASEDDAAAADEAAPQSS